VHDGSQRHSPASPILNENRQQELSAQSKQNNRNMISAGIKFLLLLLLLLAGAMGAAVQGAPADDGEPNYDDGFSNMAGKVGSVVIVGVVLVIMLCCPSSSDSYTVSNVRIG
jgi:predicted cobalt transporter CbtA